MKILLSDGSGLTARQSATLLAGAGHRVEALSPDPLCLCRFTRHVHRLHKVPVYGADPFGWLTAALQIADRRGADLLFPTQEQVAVLSLAADRLHKEGLATAVPDFGALIQVQDKLAAFATLTRLGLPQPATTVITNPADLAAIDRLPVFVKSPIGTASLGVRRLNTPGDLHDLTKDHDFLRQPALLVQEPVTGPLVMAQSVFAHGELVAFHACERLREGASGGASHKRGIRLPEVRDHLNTLGTELGWHGGLSADVILGKDGPRFIDVNPRLVEPMNAFASGVDLVGAMVEVARTGSARPQPDGAQGVRTHQLLLAILAAAQHGNRRDIARQIRDALTHRADFRDSTEELTPPRRDLRAVAAPVIIAASTLLAPANWRHFTSGSVGNYALTPAGWDLLTNTWLNRTGSSSVERAST
jgi:glutathione synthase/RimK-type ligase-like ATP-grasp enzyme